MATTIIGSIFILIMGLLCSPIILIVWGFSLICRFIRTLLKGVDGLWEHKQEEKYYQKY